MSKKKIAILFYGMLRNYQISSSSFYKNIIEKNECDIFFFGPSKTDTPTINYGLGIRDKDGFFIKNPKESKQATLPLNTNDFVKRYSPYLKDYIFHEKDSDFFEEQSQLLCSRDDWLMGLNPARMLSMFYNINGVINLFLNTHKKNFKDYDIILLTRTDLIIYNNIMNFNIKKNEIHIPFGEGFNEIGKKHTGNASVFYYKNIISGDYVPGGREDSFNDQIMAFSPKTIKMFQNIYQNVKTLMEDKIPLSPETILFLLSKRNDIKIISHPEWEYEIYRDGKNNIVSLLDTEELKEVDRYHPKLLKEKNEEIYDLNDDIKEIYEKSLFIKASFKLIKLIATQKKYQKLEKNLSLFLLTQIIYLIIL